METLKGTRKGQWRIRINDQWRVCFVWRDGNAERSDEATRNPGMTPVTNDMREFRRIAGLTVVDWLNEA